MIDHDRVVLDFCYEAIQLDRLDWRDYVRRENPVASALMAKMDIAPEDRSRVKFECLGLLTSLSQSVPLNKAKMQVILGFVDSYLRLDPEEEAKTNRSLEFPKPRLKGLIP
ncbi:MAG TPA: hypothetical protein VJX67_00025 [Blastocatellia bacterium]|nr:hypothetical protein [Blastocatellia bacterium]